MRTPTIDAVSTHAAHGGLWRASFNGARMPIFVRLTVRGGAVCLPKTDAKSTREYFEDLTGATWTPVDGNGDAINE